MFEAQTVTNLLGSPALQNVALIFFGGALVSKVRDHDRRIDKLESGLEKWTTKTAQLAGREDVDL